MSILTSLLPLVRVLDALIAVFCQSDATALLCLPQNHSFPLHHCKMKINVAHASNMELAPTVL